MKHGGLRIAGLDDALAEATGIRSGDRILYVNGESIQDELDYRFFIAEENVTLEILRPSDRSRQRLHLNDEALAGLRFAPMQSKRCRNRCLFCFVDQLPEGMRKPLYVKDEDYRFSFLYGNYVTLASVTDEDLARICRLKLSPLYVSVHATRRDVRNLLLGRKSSRDIFEVLQILSSAGISLHTQVVLCPGINDGKILEETVCDLAEFYPAVASIAVVPVGLTRFRRGNNLFPLRALTKKNASKIIKNISILQNKFKVKYDDNLVYLADEFYWKAAQDFPAHSEYGDFSQWENGVGMIPLFYYQWKKRKKPQAWRRAYHGPELIAVTGALSYPYLSPYVKGLRDALGLPLTLMPVENKFFGRQVKVTGLITGRDIVNQLRPYRQTDTVLLIPEVMLNEGRFLDDITPDEVGELLRISVAPFQPDPEGFEKKLKVLYKYYTYKRGK